MSADGELYINETCQDTFQEDLDLWYGKGKAKLDYSDYMNCWDLSTLPDVMTLRVLDAKTNEPIGRVEITNEFFVEGGIEGKYVNVEPRSIKRIK